MWLIPEDSGAYDYTIPDDDIFYIMATSGIYANQSDAFEDLTTNWIGVSHMLFLWTLMPCPKCSPELLYAFFRFSFLGPYLGCRRTRVCA